MENELHDKTKVDRGLLNSWFNEVQRTKVNNKGMYRSASKMGLRSKSDRGKILR